MCSEEFLKNSVKLLNGPFLVMLQTFLIRRVLKGELGTQRTLQWLVKVTPSAFVGCLGTREHKGHLGT